MADIKVRDVAKKTVKAIDKSAIATERFKDTIVHTKERAENATNEDGNINEYGSSKIGFVSNRTVDESVHQFNKQGKKSLIQTKDNIQKSKIKIKAFKEKRLAKKTIKGTTKGAVKNTKTAIKTSKEVAKNTKRVAQQSVKASQRAVKLARETAKATARGVKVAVKATISTVKAIIAGTKALIAALVAGGWVAVVAIIIICLVGLLCSSIFGIFFSSEDTGGSKTMNTVVNEINQEMANKITNIQNNNTYDDYKIDSDRAEWKEVLAVYTVKVSKGTNEVDVITLDDNKIAILKEVFWDMNTISSEVKTEKVKNEDGVEEDKKILHIKITSKSPDDMASQYHFNTAQKNQLAELMSEEYANLWSSAIYGSPLGSPNIVQIALSQVGNVGGQPYWSWYGFNSRVEWCACFVSWVANQAGYIESNIIPKFAGCQNGIDWFKAMGQWKEKGYIPREGDIIFFDWEVDGSVNHVGIVEKVENGKVYTVEGNSTDDMCRQKEYDINSKVIFGYGTPAY